MAAELHRNDNGTWRKLKEIHYNDNGTWRKLKEVWRNDNGTWRKVFSGASPVNPSFPGWSSGTPAMLESAVISPTNALAYVNFVSDGTFTGAGTSLAANQINGNSWYSPTTSGIGSSYWGQMTYYSGSSINYATLTNGGWSTLAATKYAGMQQTSVGFRAGNFTPRIASDSGGSSIVSASSTGAVYVEAFVDV